ncbi:MAG: hypothetical protein AAFX99_22845 [Myxococcota bacterium]
MFEQRSIHELRLSPHRRVLNWYTTNHHAQLAFSMFIMLLWLLVEVLLWHQFVLATIMVLSGLYGMFKSLWAWSGVSLIRQAIPNAFFTKVLRDARLSMISGLTLIGLGILAFGINIANITHYSPWAFETVISACKKYRDIHGHYPDKLEELTPDHLSMVPPAKISLTCHKFHYRSSDKGTLLGYIILPPFMKMNHHFEQNERFTLD